MRTNAIAVSAASAARGFGRRSLLAMATVAALPFGMPRLAEAAPSDATATIKQFNEALLSAMKAGEGTGFSHRFQALQPAVDQAFDLQGVLAVSIGPSWATLPPDQQSRLLDAFRRYTIASYVANFSSYNGQGFTVEPEPQSLGADRVIVRSRINPASGEPIQLDYVMKQTASGWKIVDVLAAGSISRVAVQRSDFRHLLSSGGGEALLASLQRKTSDLSGGMVA